MQCLDVPSGSIDFEGDPKPTLISLATTFISTCHITTCHVKTEKLRFLQLTGILKYTYIYIYNIKYNYMCLYIYMYTHIQNIQYQLTCSSFSATKILGSGLEELGLRMRPEHRSIGSSGHPLGSDVKKRAKSPSRNR